jgi:cellulose synthase/poly-beta-1,6-N-acetylglucosamine synthase-like glycosyltransferase
MVTLIITAAGIAILGATLPVVLELAALTAAFLVCKRKRVPADPSIPLQLAIIIPAHNEQLLIGTTIESLRASLAASREPSSTRILAIAHNCSDRTSEHAADAGAEVLELNDPQAQGKGFALRYGFDQAFSEGADAVLVIDADSTVSANLIDQVRGALAAGAEAVQCRYEMARSVESAKAKLSALALRAFNLIRPAGRSRLGFSAGILGNGFAVSKPVFLKTPYEALSLVEDLEYHIHLVIRGTRVMFLEEAQVFSELPVSNAGNETQRSRWEGGRLQVARRWLGPLAKRVACGQFRLTEPLFDLAGIPLAYAAALLLVALFLPLPWLRIYAAAAMSITGVHVLAAAAAGESFWDDLRVLGAVPVYMFWKLRLVPKLLRGSTSTAAWIRTERVEAGRKV